MKKFIWQVVSTWQASLKVIRSMWASVDQIFAKMTQVFYENFSLTEARGD